MSDSAKLLHLSDLHLCQPADRAPPPALEKSLVAAIAEAAKGTTRLAIAITGDLVDSSDTAEQVAVDKVGGLIESLREVVPDAPILLMPGNHDRRVGGVIAPWSHALVGKLRDALHGKAHVEVFAPGETEPLASLIPSLSNELGAEVVAYDTTHTLEGKFSAGGLFRPEDLFAVPGIVGSKRPVVLLAHHHLIPTPVTDASAVDGSRASWLERLLVERTLPWLVSFGNREELFMTALRAGTALTQLHSLESPVVVLHGHKHYPTARVLRAVSEGDGDVLLASAGSAGLLEPYRATGPHAKSYIWPSFNVVSFDGAGISVETVFFSPNGTKPAVRQPLVAAKRAGASWNVEPVPEPSPSPIVVDLDAASFAITPGAEGYYDFTCDREVRSSGGFAPYEEVVEAPSSSELSADAPVLSQRHGRTYLKIKANVVTSYRAKRALCRTRQTALREYPGDDYSPFEWVGLHVSDGTKEARLSMEGIDAARAFATVTDLHTGQERPLAFDVEGGNKTTRVTLVPCAARRLVRIYWALERE